MKTRPFTEYENASVNFWRGKTVFWSKLRSSVEIEVGISGQEHVYIFFLSLRVLYNESIFIQIYFSVPVSFNVREYSKIPMFASIHSATPYKVDVR